MDSGKVIAALLAFLLLVPESSEGARKVSSWKALQRGLERNKAQTRGVKKPLKPMFKLPFLKPSAPGTKPPCEQPIVVAPSPEGMAGAPLVFKSPFHQSPVRGEPDDLLTIAGSGFDKGDTVVYRRMTDTTQPLAYPDSVPSPNSVEEGVAPVVSFSGVPHSLTVRLPAEMASGDSYALWVRNAKGAWSAGMRINDARPLWISPAVSYETAQIAGLPREIKVVGRNLQPKPGSKTQVTLIGPQTYTLTAGDDGDAATAIERYAARVKLPTSMPAGTYSVAVSRDGVSCVPLQGGQLVIRKDPIPPALFNIDDEKYGGCRPDDSQDDTSCIVEAIADASNAGGGRVFFGPGTWDLDPDPWIVGPVVDPKEGIVVPQKVDLAGGGADQTHVVQSLRWKSESLSNIPSVFTLLGENTVQGIDFVGEYNKPLQTYLAYLSIGKVYAEPQTVSDIRIFNNKFSGMYFAIGNISNWGWPIKNLFIVSNDLHASRDSLFIRGGAPDISGNFKIEDSVIAFNVFHPGDFKADDGVLWPIASEVYGSHGLDFSGNKALGTKDHPFRAGFFWSLHSNNERLLISENKVTCTETHDAEAFMFDEAGGVDGSKEPFKVAEATADTVSVTGDWLPKPPDFYKRHWVFIADGKGLGQVRKITGYTAVNPPLIEVSPPWDVVPDATSVAVVKRNYWQTILADNVVDMRDCAKNNPLRKGGHFGWSATASDSAIEGNRLYDSDGIIVFVFNGNDRARTLSYASEVRGNLIDGEYDPTQKGAWGGLNLLDASMYPQIPSPVIGYNLSVSHNTVINAETGYQAGISIRPGFHPPTTPYLWKNVLIFRNTLKDLPDWGIGIHTKYVWDTILYKNDFGAIAPDKKVIDAGTNTLNLDASP